MGSITKSIIMAQINTSLTWERAVNTYLIIWDSLNDEGKETAKKDLLTCAVLADRYGQMKVFVNGFESWQETHFEIVQNITLALNKSKVPVKLNEVQEEQGTGGLYELAQQLTDKFENNNKSREWDGEFFEEIDKFLKIELNN